MGYAIEAMALILLAVLGWRTWRAGAGAAAYAAVGIVLALVVTVLVAWLSDVLIALATGNLLARLAIPLLASTLAFALVQRAWMRRAAWRAAWGAAFASRLGAARAVLVGVLIAQLALAVLLAAVAVNLIARRWPDCEAGLRGRTVIARHLLIGSPPVPMPTVPDSPAIQQRRLASGLGRLFSSGRDAVADATGMAPAMEAIDILREINGLDHDRKLWLVRNHPALGRLVDHPPLRAVATDPAVLDEIERVATGSLSAAWRLGDRADIQALFADPEIRAAVAAIHFTDLRAAWRARCSEGQPVPVAWRVRDGDGPERESPAGGERLTCAGTASTVTVHGWLPGEIGAYRLDITGLAAPRLLIGGQPCRLVARADGVEAAIAVTTAGGEVELTVHADAPATGGFGLALSRVE